MSAMAATLVAVPLASLLSAAGHGGSDTLLRLATTVLPAALWDTVWLLSGVAVLTAAIGSGTAWLVTAFRFPGSRIFAWLLPLPLAVPTYVTALVYVEILDAAGPVRTFLRGQFGRELADHWFPEVRSLPSCILLMSLVLYPYVYVAARAAFLAREPSVIAAARTLGGRSGAVFLRISLALARPAIAVGVTLALLEALNDIGAAEYLGVRTLTVSAYTAWLNRGDLPGAAQIACLALGFVALLLFAEGVQRERKPRNRSPASSGLSEPVSLGSKQGLAAAGLCLLPCFLGFMVPAGFLLIEVVRRNLVGAAGPNFTRHVGATLAIAGVATTSVVAVGLAVVLGARFTPTRVKAQLGFLASLGYAVPGTILVLGLLGPLAAMDGALARCWETISGRSAGLILISSGAAIVIALLIRFLRVATETLSAQLGQSPPEIEHVARVLGAGPGALAWHVQLPLLRPALGGATLLVFVDCIKELPATLLLRPVAVETLATLVYGAASRGSFEEGGLAALLIVAAGIGPILWLTRAMRPEFASRGRRSRLRRPSEMFRPSRP